MNQDIKKIQPYINRELSWLMFNQRVLEESEDESVPLFERLRFASIFMSNLDEFFMVRVGTLFDQTRFHKTIYDTKTGLSAKKQLDLIFERVKNILPRKDASLKSIMEQLKNFGVCHLDVENLGKKDYEFVKNYFEKEMFPLVSPQIIDKHHPFPFLKNKELYVGVRIAGKNDTFKLGIVPASENFERIVFIPSKKGKFVLAEDIIRLFADKIFKKHKIVAKTIFRITRNADLEFQDMSYDFDLDYRQTMSRMLKKRPKLAPVRLELYQNTSSSLEKDLCERLRLFKEMVFASDTPLCLNFIDKLQSKLSLKKELFFEPLSPQKSPYINQSLPMIPQILENDLFLHFPYNDISPLIKLVSEAANDPSVVSIKITLYRVASDSKIITALIAAAENGKQVMAAVELRARFDEENNIDWSKRLEDAGCSVIYGIDGYKVHSKLLLITRKKRNGIEYITQIGTGNYNEKTARFYTDMCLMTSHKGIGEDAANFFNSLFMGSMVDASEHLLVAPLCLKSKIMAMIDEEISFAKKDLPAQIILKLNSISDKEVIDKLIEAAGYGVKIKMIVRGICCFKPFLTQGEQNIEIISIVGRFLEHSRVYVFGLEERQSVYISSADFMTRNTDRRVEVAAPVYDPVIKDSILNIVEMTFMDNVKSRMLMPNGTYEYKKDKTGGFESQLYLYKQAYCLSGKKFYQEPTKKKKYFLKFK